LPREGEEFIREASPLFDSRLIPLLLRGGEEILERGETPLLHTLPLPFTNTQGKGVSGIGYEIISILSA
jgi:hypothetical protein